MRKERSRARRAPRLLIIVHDIQIIRSARRGAPIARLYNAAITAAVRTFSSERAGVHGITPPGLVPGAAVERLAGGPADVAGADTGLAEDLRGAHDQGRPDPLTVQRRSDTDAADGPRGRAEHRREPGVRAGALQQQGPGDRPGPGPGKQAVLGAARGEPARPAGEGSRL